MLFQSNEKINLLKDEIVKVILHEGDVLYGVVEEVKGDVVWLRASKDRQSKVARFNAKIDKFIKLN
jgi:hypothetical protein